MAERENFSAAVSSAFILLASISALGLIIPRHDTDLLFLSYFSGFFAYFWFCRFSTRFIYVLGLGILCRLILFFGLPALSDDIYRFLWDGYLLKAGISPFVHLPRFYAESTSSIPGLSYKLYENLNSPEYFSVYPPLNQFVFRLSVETGNTWLASANIIRSLLFIADTGSFLLLRKLLKVKNLNPSLANWYFLNPLVILEITGNLHFEGLVIFFLITGLYFLSVKKSIWSGVGFGMAIATKLLPLIYLPAILLNRKIRNSTLICSGAVLVSMASFLPMLDTSFIRGLQSGISLYINKFEFNGSIYFLLREIGYWFAGYNAIWIIGPVLAVVTLLLIIWLVFYAYRHHWTVEKTMLFSLTAYLLLATTVHPWYILPLVVFGLLSGFYFPIIWSLMIFVTYFGYTKEGFELSAWWVVLEYVMVFLFIIIELAKKSNEEVV